MVLRSQIISKGGPARGLLPLYSTDQLIFTTGLLGAIYGLTTLVEPDAAAIITMFAAIGGLAANYASRPAYLRLNGDRVSSVEEALHAINYLYVTERDHWVPPIPRWLRWSYNFVKIEKRDTATRVYGPANLLRYLTSKV